METDTVFGITLFLLIIFFELILVWVAVSTYPKDTPKHERRKRQYYNPYWRKR